MNTITTTVQETSYKEDQLACTFKVTMNVRCTNLKGESVDLEASALFTQSYTDNLALKCWDVPHIEIGAPDLQYGEMSRVDMVTIYASAMNAACDRFERFVRVIDHL